MRAISRHGFLTSLAALGMGCFSVKQASHPESSVSPLTAVSALQVWAVLLRGFLCTLPRMSFVFFSFFLK